MIDGPGTGFVPDPFLPKRCYLDPDLKSDTLENAKHPELHPALTFAIPNVAKYDLRNSLQ